MSKQVADLFCHNLGRRGALCGFQFPDRVLVKGAVDQFAYHDTRKGTGERQDGGLFADSLDEAYAKLKVVGIRPGKVYPFGERRPAAMAEAKKPAAKKTEAKPAAK